MGLVCPECSAPQGLQIRAKIELPPDSRSDEITLQVVECSRCDFAGIAAYEESRRGGLDSESFSHVGYRVSSEAVGELRRMIRQCPQPGNARCECAAHAKLGSKDRDGRWSGLSELSSEGEFELRL
jgi:hypothetical protein